MINKVININVDYKKMGVEPSPGQPTLTTYVLDENYLNATEEKKRPAVVICPGGAYSFVSAREAEPIALAFCAAGYHAFVLDYSVAPSGWPASICELSKAMAYVKEHAEEYNILKNKIFVCGFSAGGHLAASLAVHHSRPEVLEFAGIKKGDNIPRGAILSYPVITADERYAHKGSIDNLSCGRAEVRELASLENYVTEQTPPAFIWHTFTDASVPVQNSLMFASALVEKKVPVELHVYQYGQHGLSLGSEVTGSVRPPVQNWVEMAVRWIKEIDLEQ